MIRLRVRFRRGEELKFISHLDIIRLWVRALRRAQIPLEYSEGFSPHPRISLAVPLSVGVTADNELMDIIITKAVSPHWFMDTVNRQLPDGLKVLEASPIGLNVPSLQSQVRFTQYQVKLKNDKPEEAVKTMIDRLLYRSARMPAVVDKRMKGKTYTAPARERILLLDAAPSSWMKQKARRSLKVLSFIAPMN